MEPYSCDTFVALPNVTKNGGVIFGKNSDRPRDEVQEVIYVPEGEHAEGATVQCTYLEIPQVPCTKAVVLSKPAWMWGAEMAANSHGVCLGNEAVSTKLQGEHDLEEKLLGMDLIRLGAERGNSAEHALGVITSLLETYGQGGPCTDSPDKVTSYHNSFIIADPKEAWVLETAGQHWAAQRLTDGVRNISNQLSIGTDISRMSVGLTELCEAQGWWRPEDGPFNFAKAMTKDMPPGMFSSNETPNKRYAEGRRLMEKHATGGAFNVESMMSILRDKESSICRVGKGSRNIASTGSQVSELFQSDSNQPNIHWFTATPNPACSSYKPFVFNSCGLGTDQTKSPVFAPDPAKEKPRFSFKVDRGHALFHAHAKICPCPGDEVNQEKLAAILEREKENVKHIEDVISGKVALKDGLWAGSVQAELDILQSTPA